MEIDLFNCIKKAKIDDSESIELLIEKFKPLILKYSNKLNSPEDAISELSLHLIKIINKIPLEKDVFKEEKYIISYVSTSIKRYFFQLYSKQQKNSNGEMYLYEDYPDITYNESNIVFYDLIKKLNSKEQLILEKKFVYSYTNTEIAMYLNVSRQNVQVSIKRALMKLQKCI